MTESYEYYWDVNAQDVIDGTISEYALVKRSTREVVGRVIHNFRPHYHKVYIDYHQSKTFTDPRGVVIYCSRVLHSKVPPLPDTFTEQEEVIAEDAEPPITKLDFVLFCLLYETRQSAKDSLQFHNKHSGNVDGAIKRSDSASDYFVAVTHVSGDIERSPVGTWHECYVWLVSKVMRNIDRYLQVFNSWK